MTHPSRERGKSTRCPQCGLPRDECICALAPRPAIRTEFIIVCHAKEVQRASNTARLAQLAMPGTKILLRGLKDRMIPGSEFARPGAAVYVLFPADDAVELNEAFVCSLEKPLVIVVPDGSWRQAKSAVRREAGICQLPRLKLPAGPASRYLLRTQPSLDKVSTYEAIARAVGILEGEDKQRILEEYFDEKVRRTLRARGRDEHGERLGFSAAEEATSPRS